MTTRRELLQKAAAAAPAIMVGSRVLGSPAARAASPVAGKNIVMFITDQDRAIQHFPEGWAEQNLPGLTRLQETGVTFENAFCNACMCSPSRATMFTGYFPAQHGVKYTLEEDMPEDEYPQVELPTDMQNLAGVMHSAGYEVVYKGKWHLSKPAGEDFVPEDLLPYGFTRWNPPDAGADQSIPQEGGGKYDNDGRYMDSRGEPGSGEEGVLQYLASRAAADRPFFMIISLVNPHDVLLYPKNYVDGGYDDSWLAGNIELPPTVDEDLSSKPDAQANFRRIFNLTGRLDTEQKKLDYVNFYGNLMKVVDGYLVEVLDALEEVGLRQDTLVIRTSDHGEMGLAHGGLRQKNFNAYEETLRVPLVYSNPEMVEPGTTCEAMVSHVDLVPTLASLVEAPRRARRPWQGRDYSELVLGKTDRPVQDDVVFTFDDYQAGQKNGPYVKPPQHIVAVREKHWKIAKYYDADRRVPPQWELYDLKHDRYERRNLAGRGVRRTARQQANFMRMKRKLRRVERRRLQPLPFDRFGVRSVTAHGAVVSSKVRVPGRGSVVQKATATVGGERVVVGKATRRVGRKGTRPLELRLNEAGRDLLREGSLDVRVRYTFRPDGGTTVVEFRELTLRRAAAREAVAA